MRYGYVRWMVAGVLLAAAGVSSAKALVVRMPSVPERVAMADAIIVGKVISIDDKTVEAAPFPGSPGKTTYQIANIKISDSILGARGVTNIRVGFIPQPDQSADPTIPRRPILRPGTNVTLKASQEGAFFLTKHFEADFFVPTQLCNPVLKGEDGYDKHIAAIKKLAKVYESPIDALKAKDPIDRLQAATMLMQSYRRPVPGKMKQVDVPAEESKLILTVLMESDWTQQIGDMIYNPQMLFSLLNPQPSDGFQRPQPKPGENYAEVYQAAAKEWLKKHADTYRIKRWALDKE